MTFIGPGPLNNKVITENIYSNFETGLIQFVVLDGDGKETDFEVMNCLLSDPLRIEYYARSVSTKERQPFQAPKDKALFAIEKSIDIAKAASA